MSDSGGGGGDETAEDPNVTTEQQPQHPHPSSLPAQVDLWDESHGVFGQWTEPSILVQALEIGVGGEDAMVGAIDDPTTALLRTVWRSLPYGEGPEIVVEFENWTSSANIQVRWMDEQGHNPKETHCFSIPPQSTLLQYSKPGHLFVLSTEDNNNEPLLLLGAYRVIQSLPSGSAHCVLIETVDEDDDGHDKDDDKGHLESKAFRVEAILTDETKRDALTVVAAALEQMQSAAAGKKHISILHTVVRNVLQHPNEPKYQTLRTTNQTVQHHIMNCPPARHMLHILGFEEEEDCLIVTNYSKWESRFHVAMELLDLLQQRAEIAVAELAPQAPWQPPDSAHPLVSHGTHFITPEERWARVERWHTLRGRARRPEPGEAPSSRGTWGR